MVEQVRISSNVAHRIVHQGIVGRLAVVREIQLVHQKFHDPGYVDVDLIQLLDDLSHDVCASCLRKELAILLLASVTVPFIASVYAISGVPSSSMVEDTAAISLLLRYGEFTVTRAERISANCDLDHSFRAAPRRF